ncbi:MAG: hypothetical protein IPM51_13245 [Sphingobacteriaceae bacterium]|nr:hypothetical protein [Sphingobacteriaceae bacterium]
MLNLVIKFKILILFILLYSCNEPEKPNYKLISKKIIGETEFNIIYQNASDSINSWTINKLGYYKFCGDSKNCFLDSLICFNTSKTRFIGCVLKQQLLEYTEADDIDLFYGEFINSEWFFFDGYNIIIPRDMVKGHPWNKPLSYQQLHEIALEKVYNGYLINGQINENWFKAHFEGIAWGDFKNQGPENDWYLKGRRFKTEKEFYEAMHLSNVKNNWLKRDTTKPIIPLPEKSLP